MKNATKTQLTKAVEAVNKRYAKGLNDDDQVKRMIEISNNCKGFTFHAFYDEYEVVTDEERMKHLVEKYGYWSEQVKTFNSILNNKGGNEYKNKLNAPYIGTANAR